MEAFRNDRFGEGLYVVQKTGATLESSDCQLLKSSYGTIFCFIKVDYDKMYRNSDLDDNIRLALLV